MTSRKFTDTHSPCPCGKSSDAASYHEDGSGFCFSCSRVIHSKREIVSKKNTDSVLTQKVLKTYRGIAPETFEFFGVKMAVPTDTDPFLIFPRPDGTSLQKNMNKKEFWFQGERDESKPPVFGMDRFPPGSAKAVTITEGYLDALSVYQMMGGYPVISVQSSSSAKTECSKAYEYINSFDKIYLALDSDEPGQEAAKKIAMLFDFNKVYVVKMDPALKDANAYLQEGKKKDFEKLWWNAKRFLPEGILSTFNEFDRIIDEDKDKPSIPYPWETLQGMTYGIRTGELVLFTALEGIGKTEIFRALEYHLLKTTDDNIGIIHLEEGKARTLKGLAGYELRRPVHLPEWAVSKEELKNVVRKVASRDERIHIYSHFGSDDPDDLLGTIRFLAGACNCKRIFLDHISMVVSGLQGDDERKSLDYISTRLAMMVEELDFSLFMISHVNDEGQTRGSRNIAKVADLRIDLSRDIKAESIELRNKTHLMVSKNRFAGKTGPGGILNFDPDTFCLSETDESFPV